MKLTLLATAIAALALADDEVMAHAVRDGRVVIATTAGQKLVYDPNDPAESQVNGLAPPPEEEAGAPAPASTEGAPNTSTAEGQVEVDVSAAAGEATALPVGSPDASADTPAATAEAQEAPPAGGKPKGKKAGVK